MSSLEGPSLVSTILSQMRSGAYARGARWASAAGLALAVSGPRDIPQIGQTPAWGCRIWGCIGQV